MKDILLGLVRHLLTTAGGTLITKGVITSTTLDQGVGALLTVTGVAWSVAQKIAGK
jgi:hypothetical protein